MQRMNKGSHCTRFKIVKVHRTTSRYRHNIAAPIYESTPVFSERRCRIDLNRGYNGCDELEENNKVEIDPHSLDLFLLRMRYLLPRPARFPSEWPLLLRIFAVRDCTAYRLLAGELLRDDTVVHAFDDFFHDAGVLARMHRRSL